MAVVLCLLFARSAAADDCGGRRVNCGRCGKSCKVVRETKKVKKTVWVVECEELCAPLPGCNRCKSCRQECQSCDAGEQCGGCRKGRCKCCGKQDPCRALQERRYVPPKCGKVRTRKKLVKKEITCEIPVYKCEVCDCQGAGRDGESAEEASPPEAAPEAIPEEPPIGETTDLAPLPPVIGTIYPKSR